MQAFRDSSHILHPQIATVIYAILRKACHITILLHVRLFVNVMHRLTIHRPKLRGFFVNSSMFKSFNLLYTKTKPEGARRAGDPDTNRHEGGRCPWADLTDKRTTQTSLAAALLQGMDVLQGDALQFQIRQITIYVHKIPGVSTSVFPIPQNMKKEIMKMKIIACLLCAILFLFGSTPLSLADGDAPDAYDEEVSIPDFYDDGFEEESSLMYISGRPYVRLRQTGLLQ